MLNKAELLLYLYRIGMIEQRIDGLIEQLDRLELAFKARYFNTQGLGNRRKPYRVNIRFEGVHVFLGSYETQAEAKEARRLAGLGIYPKGFLSRAEMAVHRVLERKKAEQWINYKMGGENG